ncbi:MAG: serine/threonine protein kinase [Gammaproteobacteria bacterium]|nr:serine/threonine protein kinase [Gammaproteobacteria bacterium]
MAASQSHTALPQDYLLGEYQIHSVLGHGGFGITYLAKDTKLNSLVAIKEYFPQSFAVRDEQSTITPANFTAAESYQWGLEEFLKEARVLAKFKHNYIVRVLRFLEANGTAYMVMEYEQGESLESYLRKRGGFLDEKSLFSIFLPILSGLQAVHDAGILHLDIKPDNIYLRASGQPMLIDFGSASRVTKGEEKKAVALTPAYTAIENYPNKGDQGPWSDIYSIGATIYRCITGKQPTNTINRFEAAERKLPDPLIPATKFERPIYSSYVRECVDWAMQLAPEDRPRNARSLQNGLMGKGMTNDEPEENKGNLYRSGFIGIASIDDSLVEEKRSIWSKMLFGSIFAGIMFIFMLKAGMINEQELERAVSVVAEKVSAVYTPIEDKFMRTFRLRRDRPSAEQSMEAAQATNVPVSEIRMVSGGFNPAKERTQLLSGHVDQVQSMAFMQNGSLLASASADGIIKIWKTATGELVKTLHSQQNREGIIAASSDGDLLATISSDNSIVVWSLSQNAEVAKLVGHVGNINRLSFSPDGARLVSASEDKSVIVWDLKQKSIIYQLQYDHNVTAAAFSPNGRWLATGDSSGEVKYWAMSNGAPLANFTAHDKEITSVLYSPDGKWLATAGSGGFLKLWNVGLTESDRPLAEAPETIKNVGFSPDSHWVLAAGSSSELLMWNTGSQTIGHRLSTDTTVIESMAVSADGRYIATAHGVLIKLWASP